MPLPMLFDWRSWKGILINIPTRVKLKVKRRRRRYWNSGL
jgi:hypothetical protein